jgi:hypothetical protein
MRVLIFLAIAVSTSTAARAADPEKFYYLGEVKLSSADGKPMGSQVILLEKIHDRDKSKIVERALVIQPDGKAEERNMEMTVKDDNSFTLTDDTKSVSGGGQLFGSPWKWTYFKATFKASNGVQIDDENYMADESVGVARKKITLPNGNVYMFMDMSLKSVTPKTYEILRAGLMKK